MQTPERIDLSLGLVNQIQANHPFLETKYVVALAAIFSKAAEQFEVDAHRLAAIAMQESGYVVDAKNCYYLKGKMHCDYCMMQVNDQTIKRYKMDLNLLMTDPQYCIFAGAAILADFKSQYGKKDSKYWSRYNSSDPELRKIYERLVNRWL